MLNDISELAAELQNLGRSPGDGTFLRRAKVTAVTPTSATVTIGGLSVAGVPYYANTSLAVGDAVDVLFDGPSPRILGPHNSNGPRGSYTSATSSTAQTFNSFGTRLTLAMATGNADLWSAANNYYVVPSAGLYLLTGKVRWNDGQTAGLNVGMGIGIDTDTDTGFNSIWSQIPTTGTARRLALMHSAIEQLAAGQTVRLFGLSDGSSTVGQRSLMITRLG